MQKIRLIVNETAGSGRAARALPQVLAELDREGAAYQVLKTQGPGDATGLAKAARTESIDCIFVLGGDGTISEVSQAYIDESGNPVPGPELGVVPAGTGGDFRRTLKLENDAGTCTRRLLGAKARPMDLGVASVTSHTGKPTKRAFINILSFGLGGLVDQVVNQGPKWLGGRATFLLGTLRATLAYTNVPVRVTIDGDVFVEEPIVNVAIANGQFFGGGMRIAPDADPWDGLLDVVALKNLQKLRGIGLTPKIYRGTHLHEPGVDYRRGRRIEAEPLRSKPDVLIDSDGETPGRLPLVAEVIPGAIRIRL